MSEQNPYDPPKTIDVIPKVKEEVVEFGDREHYGPVKSSYGLGLLSTFFILLNYAFLFSGQNSQQGWVIVASFVVVGMWIHQVMCNAWWIARLDGKKPWNTPALAVVWYFVPILNLFKPLSAMMEIWKFTFKSKRGWWLLFLWWGCWLGIFLGLLLAMGILISFTFRPYHVNIPLYDIVQWSFVLAGVFFLIIMFRITIEQAKYVEKD